LQFTRSFQFYPSADISNSWIQKNSLAFWRKTQYLPESITFKSDWLGLKLAYCDALLYMHESQRDVVRNLAKHAVEHEHHKLVFRGSGNVFCDFLSTSSLTTAMLRSCRTSCSTETRFLITTTFFWSGFQ